MNQGDNFWRRLESSNEVSSEKVTKPLIDANITNLELDADPEITVSFAGCDL